MPSLRFLLTFISIALTLTIHPLNANAESDKIYSFGVVPQQSASALAKVWGPLLREIEIRSGVPLEFKTAPNIPEFEQRTRQSEYDFAYMNPYHYTVFHLDGGYQAFAKQQDKLLTGIIVVDKNSRITHLEQLRGSELVFPAPAAFAATLVTQGELKKQQINFRPKYVGSHDSVYKNVARGFFPAGGGIERTLGNSEVNQDLKVLWRSEGFPPHAFASQTRVPPPVVERVKKAMLELAHDERGTALLQAMGFKGIDQAEDQEWNPVRSLNIEILKE